MIRRGSWLVVSGVIVVCGTAIAQDGGEILRNAFVLESKLLDEESERFIAARDREESALDRLVRLSDQLDQAISNQNVPVGELRRLELEVSGARATAIEWTRETAQRRERLYLHYDRLAQLGAEIENRQDRRRVQAARVDGTWRYEVPGSEAFGVLELRTEGTLLIGHYRSSTGAHGSLRGTATGNRITVERIDNVHGRDLTLRGRVDFQAGEMTGTWQLKELAAGLPSSGDWAATKLAPGEDPPL